MIFVGKVAVVTGAARGLGSVIARHIAGGGGHVVVADIADDAGAVVVHEISSAGGSAEYRHLDVASALSWRDMFSTLDRCDVLVNNAGIGSGAGGSFDDVAGFDRLMAVNARGTFLGCVFGSRAIQSAGSGGAIVNIGSVGAALGNDSLNVGYGASKSAVRLITRSFAVRYATHGVRVNMVLPGLMPPMSDSVIASPDARRAMLAQVPMGRGASLDEVARAVVFLASGQSSYVTGVELPVDGGWLA